MIISGGVVFIFDGDILPKVTMRQVKIFVELPESSTYKERSDFVRDRVGDGTLVDDCKFISCDNWSKQRLNEALVMAKIPSDKDNGPTIKPTSKWKFWNKQEKS